MQHNLNTAITNLITHPLNKARCWHPLTYVDAQLQVDGYQACHHIHLKLGGEKAQLQRLYVGLPELGCSV